MTVSGFNEFRRGRPRQYLLSGVASLGVMLAVALGGHAHAGERGVWTAETPAASFPGPRGGEAGETAADSCAPSCHPAQFSQWAGSPHDRAMAVADDHTVLGDFEGTTFSHLGTTFRFLEKNGKFLVHTRGPDGEMADFEIKYTFGFDPLQQYLVEFPGGRLQCLTVAWDSRPKAQGGQRWFSLSPGEKVSHEDPFHWTGRYQNWNAMCAECHSTGLRKNYDPGTDTYRTTWSAIDVTCTACHGPGQAHARWARRSDRDDLPESAGNGLVVDFKRNGARYEVEACAPCHSLRRSLGPHAQPGQPFLDQFMPATLGEASYYPDGQILGEVYVYGSFVQSRMHQLGVRCTDCHDPHTAKLRASGDGVCTACHQAAPDKRFPSLAAKRYDSPSHHFHPVESSGARCVGCHMPSRTYMVVDPRRDHSLRVPRPDLSVKLGIPNACNVCHADRTAQWAADTVARWYAPRGPATRLRHYGETLAAGRAGAMGAGVELAKLAGDVRVPAIVRATTLELLAGYGEAGLAALVAATKDPAPLVRAMAARGLTGLSPSRRLATVAPLLADSIRAVRTEAARVLASVPAELFAAGQRHRFASALAEYERAERDGSDMPAGRFNLGVLSERTGRADRAEEYYRAAIGMDPWFLPARFNLARLYSAQDRNRQAERLLRGTIVRARDDRGRGEAHYSLGLLLAERGRLEDAVASLADAVVLLPDRARVRYNYGLALQRLGRRVEAEAVLLEAQQLEPNNPEIVYALAVLYAQEQRWSRALPWAEKTTDLLPASAEPRLLLQSIQRELRSADGAPPDSRR